MFSSNNPKQNDEPENERWYVSFTLHHIQLPDINAAEEDWLHWQKATFLCDKLL